MSALLKALRTQKGLTLESLAGQTGLTKSYLSKLERGIGTPSIAVALRIAAVLDVDVGQLFADESAQTKLVIDRHTDGANADRHTPLATAMLGKTMSPFVLRPGRRYTTAHPTHTGQEFLYVAAGTVQLDYDGKLHTLTSGDSAYLDASIEHRIRSTGTTPAQVVIVAADRPAR